MIQAIDESEGSKYKVGEDYVYNPELIRHVKATRLKWWEGLLVRLLGKKQVSKDLGCTVTMYIWRGRFYVISYKYEE